jgi:predicted TIM-barrel enzyme
VGASSMERLPVEIALSEATEQFKAIPIGLTQSAP